MDSEVHLFIIWEKGRKKEKIIIDDISINFDILTIYEVFWDKNEFSNNLTRFYGQNLPKNSNKERHCGNGSFLLIIVKDNHPLYRIRKTSKGSFKVNVNMFDSKEMYREWTGGGHKIHASNSEVEANHDLVLLLGTNTKDFLNNILDVYKDTYIKLERNISGFNGWKSIEELFYILNASIKYVVLRNYEMLPYQYVIGPHSDIDILTENYVNFQYIANAKPVFKNSYRVQNIIIINNKKVQFDIRYIGDNYYDSKWERNILDKRIIHNQCFYVPNDQNMFYSLLYHALIHKPIISSDYKEKLTDIYNTLNHNNVYDFDANNIEKLSEQLRDFMNKNAYVMREPFDASVYFNKKITGQGMSIRKFFLKSLHRLLKY